MSLLRNVPTGIAHLSNPQRLVVQGACFTQAGVHSTDRAQNRLEVSGGRPGSTGDSQRFKPIWMACRLAIIRQWPDVACGSGGDQDILLDGAIDWRLRRGAVPLSLSENMAPPRRPTQPVSSSAPPRNQLKPSGRAFALTRAQADRCDWTVDDFGMIQTRAWTWPNWAPRRGASEAPFAPMLAEGTAAPTRDTAHRDCTKGLESNRLVHRAEAPNRNSPSSRSGEVPAQPV